jgi:purine-binding chemotaxis protein CheW
MISRKKPQQQLACYFDELLTELDEKDLNSLENSSLEENTASHASPVSTATPDTSSSKPSEKTIAQENILQKSLAQETTAQESRVKTDTVLTQKDRSTYSDLPDKQKLPVQPSALSVTTSSPLIPAAAVKPSLAAPSPQSLPTVDLRQRDKEKLERLLNTLTPTGEQQLIQLDGELKIIPPVDTVQPVIITKTEIEAKAEIIDVPVVTVDVPTVEVVEVSKPTETTIDVESDIAVPIDMISTSPHRWQPLRHDWQENGRPAWAETPFDVLLIDVNGVQLAMPLEALDAIYPLKGDLTPLFGQAKWFMGLQKTIAGNVSVINTAQFVMPERYDKDQPSQCKYSVAINGSGWGLAVDNIHQPVLVNPGDVRWRVKRASRPWMAGMVKDHMCALIDIPYLANLLQTQDKNSKTIDT